MVAFPDCCLAVEWALTLQLALMAVPWPLELLQIDVTSEIFDPENTTQVCVLSAMHVCDSYGSQSCAYFSISPKFP